MPLTNKSVVVACPLSLDNFALATILERKVRIGRPDFASDYDGLCTLLKTQSCQFAAIDIRLDGLDALEGIRALRILSPTTRIAVLDMAYERLSALHVLEAGAHGYVPKTLAVEEMVTAFEQISRGQIYLPGNILDAHSENSPVSRFGISASASNLTTRQSDIMRHLAVGKSNKEIARQLGISESTVKVHLNSAFRKLNVHNRVSAVAALQQ